MLRTVVSFTLAGTAFVLVSCSGGGGGGSGNPTPATPAPTASPTPVATASPSPSPTPSSVEISVSGSTNTHAYTIVLDRDASATFSQDGYTSTTTISSTDTTNFFSEVDANTPVSNIPVNNGCAKSASYGTTTELTYAGVTSGDISCPPSSTSSAETLYQGTQTIEKDIQANIGAFDH